jgi:hypothetical protein
MLSFVYLFVLITMYFYQYDLLPDANQNRANAPDQPIRVTHYGQVLDVFYVEFVENPDPDPL